MADRFTEEAIELAETRDALLPRLVSGELRVGEGEDYLEDMIS